MSKFSKLVSVLAVPVMAVAFTQVATAQTAQTGSGHMGGGTQPGPGTHGHSSDPNTKEGKEIQEKQHNMPATPSHSGGPGTGKPGQ